MLLTIVSVDSFSLFAFFRARKTFLVGAEAPQVLDGDFRIAVQGQSLRHRTVEATLERAHPYAIKAPTPTTFISLDYSKQAPSADAAQLLAILSLQRDQV